MSLDSRLRDELKRAPDSLDAEAPAALDATLRRGRHLARRRRLLTAGATVAPLVVATIAIVMVAFRDDSSPSVVATPRPSVQATDAPERAPDDSEVPPESGSPRFLPAPGWDVVQVGATTTASNIPLGPTTLSGSAPWDTVDRLEEGDVVLYAIAIPAGENTAVDAAFPPGEVPLSIDDAQTGGLEGQPDNVYAERLGVQVNGWNIDLLVFYGGTEPTAGTRAAAQEQLARLDVPPRTERP
jgi:hypothetical protein